MIPVIQCIIFIVYVVIYVNVWPIYKLGTVEQYTIMLCLDVAVIVLYLITRAPTEVFWVFGVITAKDLFMVFWSWVNS